MSSMVVPKNGSKLLGRPLGEKFILASASPRRQELLRRLILEFEVIPSDINEACLDDETPAKYVSRIAGEKARAVIGNAAVPERAHCWVLAADTSVILDEVILGKPEDAEQARWMLTQLQGRQHEVLTGICLLNPARAIDMVETIRTEVWMKALSPVEVESYIGTGEPFDKAGGYAIQGLAGRFIEKIDGSYTNVIGLPIERLTEMFQEFGIVTN